MAPRGSAFMRFNFPPQALPAKRALRGGHSLAGLAEIAKSPGGSNTVASRLSRDDVGKAGARLPHSIPCESRA